MEIQDLQKLLNGEAIKIFNGKGSIHIEKDKFVASKLDTNTGEYTILESYYSLETAIIKVHKSL